MQNKVLLIQVEHSVSSSPETVSYSPNVLKQNDPDDKVFDLMLHDKYRNKQKRDKLAATGVTEFKTVVRTFTPNYRFKSHENNHFWENNKIIFPECHTVAIIVFAVACTQVSVEGLFSQLRYVLNFLRNSFSSDIIDNILLLKYNFEHLLL